MNLQNIFVIQSMVMIMLAVHSFNFNQFIQTELLVSTYHLNVFKKIWKMHVFFYYFVRVRDSHFNYIQNKFLFQFASKIEKIIDNSFLCLLLFFYYFFATSNYLFAHFDMTGITTRVPWRFFVFHTTSRISMVLQLAILMCEIFVGKLY